MKFAKNLQHARKKLKLSQQQLADMLGVRQSAVANWEAGTRSPKLSEVERIAEALLTTPAKLIE
jgi:transcriptional regulator with XRE-family HTH domain